MPHSTFSVLRSAFCVLILAAPLAAENQSAKLTEFAKGVYAEHNGDLDSARQHFETTLDADPDAYYLATKTANTQLFLHDLAAASGTLRKYTQDHPQHLNSHLYYADFLNQNSPRDATARKTAIDTLERANSNFPHNSAVFSRLINQYENAEQSDKSLALFNAQLNAPDAGPYHWMALTPIARTLLPGDSAELTEALETIALKTLETGIQIPEAVRTVSDYYRRTNRLEEAIVALQKHIEAVPNSLELRTRLGLLLIYAERDDEAEAHLLQTLEIDSDQVLAHKALGRFYADRDQIDKSLHHRAEALKIAGGDPNDFLQLANEYLDNEQPHPARLLLDKARFDHPEHPGIVARLAIATLRDGDTEAAAQQFRQAESLANDSPNPADKQYLSPEFQLEFAHALRDAGDLTAAESRLRAAAKNTPADQPENQATAFRELAKLWIEQDKNISAAISLLKRSKSLDPNNEETNQLLNQARQK